MLHPSHLTIKHAWLLLLLAGFGGGAKAQQPQEPTPSEGRRPIPGIRINSLTVYEAGYWLSVPTTTGRAPDSVSLLVGGVEGEISMSRIGRRAEATLVYRGGYQGNHRFDELNGSDHTLRMSLEIDHNRKTSFRFDAIGESRLTSTILFAPARSLTAGQLATNPDELSRSLGGDTTADLISSPVDFLLTGARRTMGSMYAQVTHIIGTRWTVQGRAGVIRDIRSTSNTPQFFSPYPSVTLGTGDASINYALSRRTRFNWATTYSRSYSRLYRFDTEAATMGVERLIGRASFARADGGYTRTAFLGEGRPGRNGYTVAGAVGTTKDRHTLVASFRRGVADLHGLGADTTIGVEGSWAWTTPSSDWALTSSIGYERLTIGGTALLDAWVYHGTVIRRLARHWSVQFDGAYANGYSGALADFSRRGCRLSLIWSPQDVRPRG